MAEALPTLVPGLVRLGRVSVFADLPDREVAALDGALPVLRWLYGLPEPPGLRQPDHLYIVREGRVALFERTLSGSPIMVALLEPGAVYTSLGASEPVDVDVLCDSAISPIAANDLEALIARYPRLGRNLAEAFSERIAMLREIAAVLGEIRVEDRLRARLRQIGGRMGHVVPEGLRIPLELTHSQWALLVGASRESVTLAFGRLRASGEVHVDGRMITLDRSLVGDLLADPAPGPGGRVA